MLHARDRACRHGVLPALSGAERVTWTAVALCVSLVAGVALVACGSGGASPSTTSAGPPRATSTLPAASVTTSPPVSAATRAAVVRAYRIFFASESTVAQSQAALQHGQKFTKTLVAQGKTSYAAKTTATVQSVRQDAPHTAAVTFTIFTGGAAALSRVEGHAVLEGGRWKVAAQTFCQLLKLEGDAPAACDDPSVTALTS